MASPLKPHWTQPSHPDIQEVVIGPEGTFTTKSVSRVSLPAFAVFADMSTPPCTFVERSTYATVQVARDRHVLLNSDLLYLNHSCEPSLIIDTSNMQILVGPRGISPGDELTFFYPSTEWRMAQPFDCACGAADGVCRRRIAGAEDMSAGELAGYWLSGHVRALKAEQARQAGQENGETNGVA